MVRILVTTVLVLVPAVLLVAASRPDHFRVERRLTMHAPAERIFPLVNDLHRHVEWSTWERKDPHMKRAHSGSPSGAGAVYEWDGNGEIGRGRMEIVESSEPRRIVLAMDFLAPMEAHHTAEFVFEPDDAGTTVIWAMYGSQNLVGKLMGLFLDVDRMIGSEFAKGLENLRTLAERES